MGDIGRSASPVLTSGVTWVDQREMVPRLGRGCLDAPQVDGKIYRL